MPELQDLPNELLTMIADHCRPEGLSTFQTLCKRFFEASKPWIAEHNTFRERYSSYLLFDCSRNLICDHDSDDECGPEDSDDHRTTITSELFEVVEQNPQIALYVQALYAIGRSHIDTGTLECLAILEPKDESEATKAEARATGYMRTASPWQRAVRYVQRAIPDQSIVIFDGLLEDTQFTTRPEAMVHLLLMMSFPNVSHISFWVVDSYEDLLIPLMEVIHQDIASDAGGVPLSQLRSANFSSGASIKTIAHFLTLPSMWSIADLNMLYDQVIPEDFLGGRVPYVEASGLEAMNMVPANVKAFLKPLATLKTLHWDHDDALDVPAFVQAVSEAVGNTLEELRITLTLFDFPEGLVESKSVSFKDFKKLWYLELASCILLDLDGHLLDGRFRDEIPTWSSELSTAAKLTLAIPILEESARQCQLPVLIEILPISIESVRISIPAWITEEMSLLEGLVNGKKTFTPHLRELTFLYDRKHPPYHRRSQSYIAEVKS